MTPFTCHPCLDDDTDNALHCHEYDGAFTLVRRISAKLMAVKDMVIEKWAATFDKWVVADK